MTTRRSLILAGVLLLGAAVETVWAGSPVVAADTQPPVADQASIPRLADRLFRAEWTAGTGGQGQSRLVGYVYNDGRQDAVNLALRITELDASGRPVASVIRPVADRVPALGRVFFDLQVPGTSPSYRVAVESFGYMDDPWATSRTEELLVAAGFQKMLADTPDKVASLRTLTPRRALIPQERDGQLYYVYADPDLCKCLYVGTSAQSEQARQQSLASDRLIALHEQRSVPIAWELWEPWPGL